ncbi:MAG: AMP-binding protein, partial [Myxococcota bacterium]
MSSETLVHRVLEHLERNPSAEVWRFWDLETGDKHVLTREAAFAAASRVAAGLEAYSTPRTLIVLPLGLDLLAAHLGTFLAGGVPALHAHPSAKISPEKYLEHLRHVATVMAPDVVLTNARFAPAVREAVAGEVIDVATLEVVATGAPPWERRRSEDLALVQHSSGSTGLQKGVALTHGMVLRQCDAYAKALRLGEADRVASWIPLYHDMGLFTSWLLPLTQGLPVSALDPFAWVSQPRCFLELITEDAGTLAWMPNFAYNLLAGRVRDRDLEGLDLSSMRGFSNCSEPVQAGSHEVFLARFGAVGVRPEALWTCYAMAENAFAATAAGVPGVPSRVVEVDPEAFARGEARPAPGGLRLVSCGVPIQGCELEVRSDARAEVEDGAVGEIALRSSYTLKEYYRNPTAPSSTSARASLRTSSSQPWIGTPQDTRR